ncbi:uncharacterized protein LOC143462456 [Clavelina lepadiformis]|uniref:uncharacterized protein LOC143462456 n=1 Tax=Clavelina lepadiformis TaxID=159417 RepID=UPI00404132F7
MDLEIAKQKFIEFTSGIKSEDLCDFINWITESDEFSFKESSDIVLESIAEDIRGVVPFEAVLPSESTYIPTTGRNADCTKDFTIHVDNFLFTDDYLDDMVEQGKFSRNYCTACGSRDTKPLTFVSHSASPSTLKFIFKKALPDLSNKTVVDIGSRLGSILYGAHLYTSCPRIIGIEINRDLCEIQKGIIEKYEMKERVSVINDDVNNCSNVLMSADVVVMNNVFEFFADTCRVLELWKFIISTVRGPNKLLLTIPSLEESFEPLGMTSLMDSWVESEVFLPKDDVNVDGDDIVDVHLYKLK